MNFLDKQLVKAKENINYFFVKMFFCFFKIIFKLCIVLIVCSFFDSIFFSIMALVYGVYSLICIFLTYKYYFDIIRDIKNTIGCDLIFEIDFKRINFDVFKGVVKYGE